MGTEIETKCQELIDFQKSCSDFAKEMTSFVSQVRRREFKKGIKNK